MAETAVKEAIPKWVWRCMDCQTVSEDATSSSFHVGCIGRRVRVKLREFRKMREPVASRSGERIWVLKKEFKDAAPF